MVDEEYSSQENNVSIRKTWLLVLILLIIIYIFDTT